MQTLKLVFACQLKTVFADALQAFLQKLDEYTLADLLPANSQAQFTRLINLT